MDFFFSKQSIDGVIRSIGALLNDSGGRNMPRVLAAFTGFWPTVRFCKRLRIIFAELTIERTKDQRRYVDGIKSAFPRSYTRY